MNAKHPKTIDEAVRFSKERKDKNGWPWARYIVEFLEEKLGQGSSISFVFKVYEKIGESKSNPLFREHLSRVKSLCEKTCDSQANSELSEEIWYDNANDSPACRGLTRILSASDFLNRTEKFRYRIEISSAIHAACDDESFSFEQMEDLFRRFVKTDENWCQEP